MEIVYIILKHILLPIPLTQTPINSYMISSGQKVLATKTSEEALGPLHGKAVAVRGYNSP